MTRNNPEICDRIFDSLSCLEYTIRITLVEDKVDGCNGAGKRRSSTVGEVVSNTHDCIRSKIIAGHLPILIGEVRLYRVLWQSPIVQWHSSSMPHTYLLASSLSRLGVDLLRPTLRSST